MNRTLLPRFGIKYNPFAPDVPLAGLHRLPAVDAFCTYLGTHLVHNGGFALITGSPGSGKSVALRQINAHCTGLDTHAACALSHPTASLSNFYRELGDLFGVRLSPHNRWGGIRRLREQWTGHLERIGLRPILLVDEAQLLPDEVMAELRLLAATEFDSRIMLTVVLAGDGRLEDRLVGETLRPLASRIRRRLQLDMFADEDSLGETLDCLLAQAGNPGLMTPGLKQTLITHAGGNRRSLSILADSLLAAAIERDCGTLDETLFFAVHGGARRGSRR